VDIGYDTFLFLSFFFIVVIDFLFKIYRLSYLKK
jgi:hypothetical protein